MMREFGTGAFVPTGLGGSLQLVRGHRTHIHDYLDAFTAAGLGFGRCIEPPITEEVLAMFQQLNEREGLTIILVTHDPGVAQHAKRSIRIHDGLIVPGAVTNEPAAPVAGGVK